MAATKIRDISLIDDSITSEELGRFTMDGLRGYCKKNGVASGGTKDVVIKRILDHLENKESGGASKEKENTEPNLSGILKICILNNNIYLCTYYILVR